MRKLNLNAYFSRGLSKGLMVISALAVLTLVLVGSFYLLVAGVVIALSTSLFSLAKGRPEPVRVRTHQSSSRQPLDAEYRVIRHK